MRTVEVSGQQLTRLGFGCAVLGNAGEADAIRLVHAVWDAGIRHFDVAPLYAFGRAEALLGRALADRRAAATITTKYGLEPSRSGGWVAPLHRIARRALRGLPAVRRRLQAAAAQTVAQAPPPEPLTAAGCRESLDRSLRLLGVERIALFLLHEATVERLGDPALPGFLEQQRRAGRIGGFGIGSGTAAALRCLERRPEYCPVVQTEWSVFAPLAEPIQRVPHLVHGSLGPRWQQLRSWLRSDPDRCERWSRSCGVDLAEPGVLPRLLLKAALEAHPHSVVLFSTTRIVNLQDNVRTLEDASLEGPARRLHQLVQAEFA